MDGKTPCQNRKLVHRVFFNRCQRVQVALQSDNRVYIEMVIADRASYLLWFGLSLLLTAIPVFGQGTSCVGPSMISRETSFASEPASGRKVHLPCKVYCNDEDADEKYFIPSGWMGNTEAIEYNDSWPGNPHSGKTCIRVSFTDPENSGGIAWQNPANNWGEDAGGLDLSGVVRLTFWARGEKGGETIEFKIGMVTRNKPYWDTAIVSLGKIELSKEWKQYTIPLAGRDLSRIVTGFVFSIRRHVAPVTFYLDDIVYE